MVEQPAVNRLVVGSSPTCRVCFSGLMGIGFVFDLSDIKDPGNDCPPVRLPAKFIIDSSGPDFYGGSGA